MYTFNKKDGLIKIKTPPIDGVKIDVVSDLHLEFYYVQNTPFEEFIANYIKTILNELHGSKEILIVGGDLSHKNSISEEFLRQTSEIWDYVLVIPGNHDWYLQEKGQDRYYELIQSLKDKENVIFLMDEVEIFEYKNIRIAGTFMAYNVNDLKDYVMWKSILKDSKFLTREFIIERNSKDVEYYNNVINHVDVFVSHVPIVNLDGRATTENLFLNMDVNPIENVLYLSGHTHRPKNSVDKPVLNYQAINVSYGYPGETLDNRKTATTIFVQN